MSQQESYKYPIPEFKRWSDLESWWRINHLPEVSLDNTNFGSQLRVLRDPTSYRTKIDNSTNPREASAQVGRYIVDCLAPASLVQQCAWVYSGTFVKVALKAAQSPSCVALKKLADKYLAAGSECTDPSEIKVYHEALLEWRKKISGVLPAGAPGHAFSILKDSSVKQLFVDPNEVAVVGEMITELNSQRAKNLGSRPVVPDQSSHFEAFNYFFSSLCLGLSPAINIEITRRSKNGLPGFKIENGLMVRDDNATGTLLASSALKKLSQENRATFIATMSAIFDLPDKVSYKGTLMVAAYEATTSFENNTSSSGSGFSQQSSNIDALFLPFFWAAQYGGVKTPLEFIDINGFFYFLGKNAIGKTKLKRVMGLSSSDKVKGIARGITDSTRIHVPPFTLTASRVDDMVNLFGSFLIISLDSINTSVSGWRTALNLSMSSKLCLTFIIRVWALERAVFRKYPDPDAIYVSTHMLHQCLLQKTSPFQCSDFVEGNAFQVEIVPYSGYHPPLSTPSVTGNFKPPAHDDGFSDEDMRVAIEASIDDVSNTTALKEKLARIMQTTLELIKIDKSKGRGGASSSFEGAGGQDD